MSFWHFPAYAKYDIIDEDRHPNLWSGALGDPDTGVESLGHEEYILYGPEEALLFRPKKAIFRIGMQLYAALLLIVKEKDDV